MAKNYNVKMADNSKKEDTNCGKARGNVRDAKDTKEYKSVVKKDEK